MNFKFANISNTSTIQDIDNEIIRLKKIVDDYNNIQNTIKVFINSIYGATASPYFIGYNPNVAEAITLQGQDVIKFAQKLINKYFLEFWKKDRYLHKKLGITKIPEITKPITIYGDTDSCEKNSIIITNNGRKTIEKLFNDGVKCDDDINNGYESVFSNDLVLNYNKDGKIEFQKTKRVFRHKVTKEKWKLKTKSSKEIIVTGDHSLVVFRDSKKMKVKPCEVLKTDKVLIINDELLNTKFDDIEICECIGTFIDEYVYDIEMDDETHTFIANDILIHNSLYCTFEEVYKDSDFKGTSTEMILKINEFRLKDFLIKGFEEYAKKWNTKNIQNFELETISLSMLLIAKKKYILDIIWKSPNIFYNSTEKIKPVGVEIMQSSTPIFVRKYINDLLKIFFEQGKNLDLKGLVNILKDIKEKFINSNVEDISFTSSVGNYAKGIGNDKSSFEVLKHCPLHVRGAGYHNFKINDDKRYKKKYSLIKSGDKIKYYYALNNKKELNVFSFLPNSFPYEFAPSVDFDLQFEKCFINPLNRFIDVVGEQKLTGDLLTSRRLF